MIRLRHIAALVLAAALAGCQTPHSNAPTPLGVATLSFADGTPAGTAQLLTYGNDSVLVSVTLAGFTPGLHAVHLHTTGACDAPDFKTAGGHLNPAMHEHGMLNPKGAHLGDLANVEIAADGTGTLTSLLAGTRAQTLAAIYDADGTAIVVHSGPDDYMTDPAGNAGSRVACGVIARADP